nr:3-deoxy-8-phosphooctulonate synthase [Saprospiraceae bacterium]
MDLKYINSAPNRFFLMSGPCAVEGEKITLDTAGVLVKICDWLNIPLIFKASYKKANRTRLDSFTGIGDERALEILATVKSEFDVPVVTDIHTAEEARMAADFVDVLQIPAFLCRQTDLLVAAANTGKWVNIKKGQFMSPESMAFAVEKVRECDNSKVILTERGTTFGYSDLVVDFRGIPTMQSTGVPVVLDCTHSLQKPNQSSGVTGGLPKLIGLMARTGIAAGVDGLFMETHPNPAEAKSDGANMLPLSQMENLLTQLVKLKEAVAEVDEK